MRRRRVASQPRKRVNILQKVRLPAVFRRYSKRRLALMGLGTVVGIMILVQLVYPWNRLTPTATIDGQSLGWMTYQEAAARLGDEYKRAAVKLELGSTDQSVSSPTLEQLGVSINTDEYIKKASYPWYLRLVPTSLWWGQQVPSEAPAREFSQKTDEYIKHTLMPYCKKEPTNASFAADGAKLKVVPAVPGGACEETSVGDAIKEMQPHLPAETVVTLPLREVPAAISDDEAEQLVQAVNARIAAGVPIQAGDEKTQVDTAQVVTWIAPAEVEGKLTIAIGGDTAKQYLEKEIAPKVTVAPGTSQITTRDFDVISRVDGAPGRALNYDGTYASIHQFVTSEAEVAIVATTVVPPREAYTRTYSSSDRALSALLENFAKDHPGSYAMTYIELDGKKRRAEYQGDKQFVTASTYKLFTAYSLLKRVDDGRESWEANASCFDKMIRLSENSCAENYIHKFGFNPLTSELSNIGLKNSNFNKAGGPYTTSNDLALLLGQLQTGQNFSPAGRDRLLGAMRANVHRQGIPAGATGSVADKPGFIDGLLHDAAIVYSPSGTYVLVIMSDGSSWANIAQLTRELEKVRTQ